MFVKKKTLKRVITILLIFIYLVSFTEIKDVLKLPSFIEHYQEHKANNSKLSIVNFLASHYFGNSKEGSKHTDDDSKLPFKAHDISCYTTIIIQDLPKTFELKYIFPKKIFEKKTQNFHYSEKYINPHSLSFFQPPEII